MPCQITTRKPVAQITDRQKRNRASKCIHRSTVKRCIFCGTKTNPRIHHLNGKEADNDPKNLVYACPRTQYSSRLFDEALQHSLAARPGCIRDPRAGRKTLGQWVMAVKSLKGESQDMHPRQAIAMIRATSPARRSSFADQIWRIRRAHGTDKTGVPF